MRKKLLSLILCLVLVCSSFAACGNKEEGAANNNDAETTETVKPEEMVTAKMQAFADEVTKALREMEQVAPDLTADTGTGMEMTLEAALGATLLENYGLTGLEKIGLILDGDFKDALGLEGALTLNGNEVLEMDIRVNEEAVYVNLPEYSENYMFMSMEDALGMSMEEFEAQLNEQLNENAAGMPSREDVIKLWEDYTSRFIKAIQYDKCQKDVTIGTGSYEFKADKYVNTIAPADLEQIINDLMAELAKYPALEVEATQVEMEASDKLYFNYYEGEDGNSAWEMEIDSEDVQDRLIVAITEKGFCVYEQGIGEPEVIFYQEKESDVKGKLVFVADDEIVIEYDNYSKNGVDLTMDIDGMELAASVQKKDGLTKVEFELDGFGIKVTGLAEAAEKEAEITLAANYQGIDFGTITMTIKTRDYKEVKMPSNAVGQEEWAAGLDQEKLMMDLQELMMDYPFLMDLFMGSAGSLLPEDDSDVEIEDDFWDDEEDDTDSNTSASVKVPDGYSDDFMSFTGYAVDADGYVDFEPSVEEVMAVGQPSTGFDTLAVTEKQREDLIAYAAAAFSDVYDMGSLYYNIFGSVEYESVESYYQEDYAYYDNTNFSNSIAVTFDAVSGELARIAVGNVSQDEAIRMANDMLALMGIDFAVTAENMEEYNTVGDVVISGYAGSTGYSVYVSVYED